MSPREHQSQSQISASVQTPVEQAAMSSSTEADSEPSGPSGVSGLDPNQEVREENAMRTDTNHAEHSSTNGGMARENNSTREEANTPTIASQTNHGIGIWKSWIAEIAWLVLSVGLLIAIAVFLSNFNNRTVPMLPLKISLNTVLAFLATLAKTALMAPVVECICQLKWTTFNQPRPLYNAQVFEDASRGPWGSAVFFYHHWKNLASIGAIVTIVGLVTTPITQLMIMYTSHEVPTTAPATVPIMEIFGYKSDASYNFEVSQFQQAIVQGLSSPLWSDEKIKPVAATCGSSNCTFSDVTSLSVCSDVRDITDSGHLQTSFIPNPDIEDLSVPSLYSDTEYTEGILAYNMSFSNEFTSNCSFVTQDPSSLFTCKLRPNKTIAFGNEKNRLSSLLYSTAILYAEPSKDHNITKYHANNDLEFRAMEAILYLCVNQYNVSVSRGNTTTSLISSTQRVVPQDPPVMVNTTCYIDLEFYTHRCDFGHKTSYENGSYSEKAPFIFLQGGNDNLRRFGADVYLLETIADYIYPQFTVYISIHPERPNRQRGYTAFNPGQALNMLGAVVNAQHDPEQQIANMKAIVDNVAISLTNQMRISSPNYGLQQSLTANGTAWVSETFVEIRWGWLAFLIAEITLSAVFVLATIARTKTLAVQPIKSSAIAALVALSPHSRASLGSMDEGRALRTRAREVYAELRRGELVVVDVKD